MKRHFCSVVLDCYRPNFVSQFSFFRKKKLKKPAPSSPAYTHELVRFMRMKKRQWYLGVKLESFWKAFECNTACFSCRVFRIKTKKTAAVVWPLCADKTKCKKQTEASNWEKMRLNVAEIKRRQKFWLHRNTFFHTSISANTSAAIRGWFSRPDEKSSKESGRQQIRGGHIMLMRVITITW